MLHAAPLAAPIVQVSCRMHARTRHFTPLCQLACQLNLLPRPKRELVKLADARGLQAGFMSASSDQRVALQYLAGKQAPTLFEISLGAVDRAASLEWCSQYPSEAEFLLPPLSFLETRHVSFRMMGGALVRVVHMRVNANLKSLLLEELVGRRKALHLAAMHHNRLELEHAIDKRACITHRLRHSILAQYAELEKRHAQRAAHVYNDDRAYREAVTEMLDVIGFAHDTLKCDNMYEASLRYLRENHRVRVREAERGMVAGGRVLPVLPVPPPVGEEVGAVAAAAAVVGGKGDVSAGREQRRRRAALDLCRLRGIIGASEDALQARNELGETPLLQAAADGQLLHVQVKRREYHGSLARTYHGVLARVDAWMRAHACV